MSTKNWMRRIHALKNKNTGVGEGVPNNNEGGDGDLRVQRTNSGIKLFAKYSGQWFPFTPDSDISDNENLVSVDNTNTIKEKGYIKLTGGFIIQWGTIATSTTTSDETFPIQFPNLCVAVMLVPVEDDTDHKWVKLRSKTTSSFEWQVSHTDADINWIALGN